MVFMMVVSCEIFLQMFCQVVGMMQMVVFVLLNSLLQFFLKESNSQFECYQSCYRQFIFEFGDCQEIVGNNIVNVIVKDDQLVIENLKSVVLEDGKGFKEIEVFFVFSLVFYDFFIGECLFYVVFFNMFCSEFRFF